MAYNLRKKARKSDQLLSLFRNQMNKDNIIVELANGRKFKLPKELTLKVIRNNKTSGFSSSKILGASGINFELVQLNEECNSNDINNDVDDDEDDDDNEDDDHHHAEDDDEKVNDDYATDHDDDDVKDVEPFKESQKQKKEVVDPINEFEEDIKNISIIETDNNDKNEVKHTEDNKDLIRLHTNEKIIYNGEEIANKIKASNQFELLSWNQDDMDAIPTFKLRRKEAEDTMNKKHFICEICGNTYYQKHRLTEHMKRHNPDKIYACEICGKRFAVSEGLRRHVLTHGARKPYKCNHCSRCFYTPSARKAHEKVHSGHKPFVCKVCAKAFAYTGSLRKHMLIHENKKLYHCEYCDKKFRLQHHMKQHEETQIHKDAVAESMKNDKTTKSTE